MEELAVHYRPHPAQQRFHQEGKRFAAIAAGVRGGKTYAAAREFLRRIYFDRRNKEGRLYYWAAAPTYAIGKVQQRELFEALGGVAGPLVESYGKADRELRLRGGILIEFKTTERPETLVAAGLDGLWLDEAARAKADAWLGGLRMRLSDRAGWAIFSTTPLGRNWFHKHIVQRALVGHPDFSLHMWRTVDNEAVPGLVEEVQRARDTLPTMYFRREYEANFDAFVGQVYEEFSRLAHVTENEPIPVETRYGVDWGYRRPGAILVLQRDAENDQWVVVDERVRAGVLVTGQGETSWTKIAQSLQREYGLGTFFCDPSAPAYLRAFRDAGLTVRPANNEVNPGIQAVARALHPVRGVPELLVHRRCKKTIDELTGYRWNEEGDGETPLKENDHACDALRYALHTRPHRPAQW
jgi:Terminase large subunit, T4likevirus-type, N-terminal